MKTEKQCLISLLKSNRIDHREIIFKIENEARKSFRPKCYEHIYYCVLYSGLTSERDLLIKINDYI